MMKGKRVQLTKKALAISCFFPLYILFFFKNVWKAFCLKDYINTLHDVDLVSIFEHQYHYNLVMAMLWVVLIIVSICGLYHFYKNSKKVNRTKEIVKLTKCENITADYFFPYFSLFIISFIAVDPTKFEDVLVVGALLLMMIWVYIINDMYFINPVLNLLGYRSYKVIYYKTTVKEIFHEVRVFSKKDLKISKKDERYYIFLTTDDFSICFDEAENKAMEENDCK